MTRSSLLLSYAFLLRLSAQALPPAPATVRGHLDHAPAGDTVRVQYGKNYGPRAFKGALSPAGDFSLVVPALPGPTMAELDCAGQHTTIYLTPGDALTLTLDFPRFDETVRYAGRGADANNYLAQALYKFEYGPAGAIPRPPDQLTATTTPAQARQAADAFRQARQAFLTTYVQAHSLPTAFQRAATAHIDLGWTLSLLEYPMEHQRLAQQAAVLPATYYDFLAQLPPHTLDLPGPTLDRGILDNTLAYMCLNLYGDHLLPGGALSTDPAQAERLYAQARAELRSAPTGDQAVSLLISNQVKTNLPGVEAAYPAFRAHTRDSAQVRDLRRVMARQRLVQAGRVAPAFTLTDNTGKAVSLADFKGKVVYLDFWGTWCGPCMAEMPASNTLKQQFAGRDVVFLYISVSDKEAKWQQVLSAAHLTGPNSVHLRSPSGDYTVPTAYNVSGYPSYLLIGRDGRIRLSNAPRPSAGAETVAALEQALKE